MHKLLLFLWQPLLLPLLSILQRPQSSSLLTEALRTPSFNLLTAQRSEAFLFSNKEITQALIRAHQRGVKVDVIIDKKMPKKKPNTTEDLLKTGVPTFFDTAHRTAHDKIIIVDDNIVLTGSFNFVKVAETKNGENLLILKSKPLAEEYVKNWEKHFSHSVLAAPEKEKGTEVPLTKNQN